MSKKEIRNIIELFIAWNGETEPIDVANLDSAVNFITESLPEDKRAKHSYFETFYHVGQEPFWKVGDILAEYEFYSDREGEIVHGEVVNVEFDAEYEDWVYTFKSGYRICESELLHEQAYKK